MSSNPFEQITFPSIQQLPKQNLNICAIGTPENYKLDTILNKLQKYDKKDISKNRNYDKNKLLIYHRFEFYRYLFSKYMNFV